MPREQIADQDLDVIIAVAMRRAALIDRLEEAPRRNDAVAALEIAREICGMEREPKS